MLTDDILINLNRLGIILNVISGFLMAPDIIGKERLNIWEQKVENLTQNFSIKLYKIKKSLILKLPSFNLNPFSSENNYERKEKSVRDFLFYSIFVSGIYLIIIIYFYPQLSKNFRDNLFFYTFLIPIICGIVIFIFDKILFNKFYNIYLKFVNNFTAIFFVIGWIYALLFLFLNFGFIISFFTFFLLFLLRCCEFILSFSLSKMEGKNRFESIFLVVGIILFILGNLFQLLATFISNNNCLNNLQ